MNVETFYDNKTATFTYVLFDPISKESGVIDSVADYDIFSGRASMESADKVIDFINQNQLKNKWILETHVHADHITAAHYLKSKIGGKIGIGSGIKTVLDTWLDVFETANDTPSDGSQFDVLFEEGDTFNIGEYEVKVWHTPGHTPACASFLVDGKIFVGDTMFAPNLGTARCDFPGGSAEQLYNTIQRFFTLPDDTTVYLGHDYPKEGAAPLSTVSIKEAKETNQQIRPEVTLQEYVEKREARDATLAVPKLLLPAIQANLRNGQFGAKSEGGKQFIKIPVNAI
ncbi:metallo-beta-lactamase family protein [Alteromonas macleodii str. 'Balearic Sea AD45']|jgi:glyoxylase-like metal-dependent hydrolase (beta-lactamase superfamily II)|uniref:MBL fold metallo-hydrolase n=1 Tax=Alteromonas macleodii TaxID=28108 RepID=UPI000286C64A|nr:MBL fold metallo-hydrolase [Alteromonas macleodii]AFT93567.1 metallo-beta-lactamase family protein [Alteromonas macleodii str. 'Balearic Sea AD45']